MSAAEGRHPSEAVQQAPGLRRTDLQQQDLSVPGREMVQAPRSWAEKVYPNLLYFHDADKGGHFAAWEEPDQFAAEIREAFKPLR